MTVGSTQRFYVVVATGNATPAGPASEQAARLWECTWMAGARLLAAIAGPQSPHYLPRDNTTQQYGDVSIGLLLKIFNDCVTV